MNMNKPSRSEQYWLDIFVKHKQSGETMKRFCCKNNISVNKFTYWRRKLILDKKLKMDKTIIAPAKTKLKEVKISHAPIILTNKKSELDFIRITYPDGVNINIPVNLHKDRVASILNKIGDFAC